MGKQTVMEYYPTVKRNKLLIHAITWIHFKGSMLSERSQSQKITYYMNPSIIFLKKQSYRDGSQISSCQG